MSFERMVEAARTLVNLALVTSPEVAENVTPEDLWGTPLYAFGFELGAVSHFACHLDPNTDTSLGAVTTAARLALIQIGEEQEANPESAEHIWGDELFRTGLSTGIAASSRVIEMDENR